MKEKGVVRLKSFGKRQAELMMFLWMYIVDWTKGGFKAGEDNSDWRLATEGVRLFLSGLLSKLSAGEQKSNIRRLIEHILKEYAFIRYRDNHLEIFSIGRHQCSENKEGTGRDPGVRIVLQEGAPMPVNKTVEVFQKLDSTELRWRMESVSSRYEMNKDCYLIVTR